MAALRMLWMGLVLLGLLGFPQTPAEGVDYVSVQPNFQQDKFLGRWYSTGLASNSSWFQNKKTGLFMCKTVVAPSTDGGLNLTSTFLRRNQCETKIMVLQPGGVPGQYNYNSPHWGGVHTITVVETDYDEYALLLSRGTKGPGQAFRMATLYSRTQTVKDELKTKFTTFSQTYGLTEEDIVFLPQPGWVQVLIQDNFDVSQLIRALDFKKDLHQFATLDQEWACEYTVQNQQLEYIASVSQHWAGWG
ncbi:hypothetical protein A6R68_02485 [Neotoma lepida]|uniref:Prostaglandin-H2 D-isomerase n=1 Tax=Neotoma lepida TaxID=56216 RepID=A0A1A6GUE4_NEOLE|nr:hypothetical protein A6R68_02485 [Neotoma lepida]